MEESQAIMLESKIHALEELLTVSETLFLAESQKLEQANKQLRDEIKVHERLESDIQQILDASGDAVKVVGRDYQVIYANSSFYKLKGLDSIAAAGKKCYEAVPEAGCFTENCPLARVLRTEQGVEYEALLKPGNGPEVPYLVSSYPYFNSDGNLAGVIIRYRNITREKQAQKIAEENAQQQGRIEMANNMLHDIGNALTGISSCMLGPQLEKNWAEIKVLRQLGELFASCQKELNNLLGEEKAKVLSGLIEALTTALQKRNAGHLEFCKKISNAVGHISAVLDLQRYYLKEKNPLLATVFDVKKIVEDALVILSSSLRKRNIRVTINTDGQKANIAGDQTRLMRLFLNVIKNIGEAFDELDPSVERKLEINLASDPEKKEVVITLSDNGIGFSPEVGEKLFTRGFTTKRSGSGIGLHESRSIIESHGGTITMESKGMGAGTFTIIKLPFPAT